MSKKAQEVAARYGRKSDIIEIVQDIINEQYHVNAFNHPLCSIVTNSEELQAYQWGLIPFWVKTGEQAKEIENMTINAKADTIFEKPSFREPIMRHRCIVPSTGYFEWHHNMDKTKTPYYIFLKNEEIFSMAGVYDIWKNPASGEFLHTFSIITTEANKLTAEIHNSKQRMPVILDRNQEQIWLDQNLSKTAISELLQPFDTNKMDAYMIDKDILKKNPRDKSIIDRME